MPTEFKLKSNKIRNSSNVKTLDEQHKNRVLEFEKNRKELPMRKKELLDYEQRLMELENKSPDEYINQDILTRSEYKTKISELKEYIYDIENNVTETEYYCQVGDILMDYYEILEENMIYDENEYEYDDSIHNNTETEEEGEKKLDTLELLNLKNKDKKKKKVSKRRKKKCNNSNKNNIMNYFMDDKELNTLEEKSSMRSRLLDSYNMYVDSSYVSEKNMNYNLVKKCENCDNEKILKHDEGMYVCNKCGEFEKINIEPERSNYKDVVPEKPGYPYKKINHFNEWLSQFQGKESVDIPAEVYTNIILELKKNRITNYNDLNVKNIKPILKNLGLSNYYEHKIYIISIISGTPPPTISREKEDKLRKMFRMIQEPFEKHRPKTRINFLSYSFVFHKFFELLELYEFLKFFPLLKSRVKLKEQDKIWEKICEELDWEFIPSKTNSRY